MYKTISTIQATKSENINPLGSHPENLAAMVRNFQREINGRKNYPFHYTIQTA
jgi:hypothetical protein